MSSSRTDAIAARGFTLIEVVIALTLVSLVMLGLFGALRGIGEASSRVSDVSDRTADMRLIGDFLHRAFAGAKPLSYALPAGEDDDGRVYFRGESDSVRWIAPLPARYGNRGLQFMQLRLARDGERSALVLDYLPYSGIRQTPDWERVETHFLIGDIDTFELRYQGAEPDAEWQEQWEDEVMPARIKIQVRAAGRYWPELIYALAPL